MGEGRGDRAPGGAATRRPPWSTWPTRRAITPHPVGGAGRPAPSPRSPGLRISIPPARGSSRWSGAARDARVVLEEIGLAAEPVKTTGSRGLPCRRPPGPERGLRGGAAPGPGRGAAPDRPASGAADGGRCGRGNGREGSSSTPPATPMPRPRSLPTRCGRSPGPRWRRRWTGTSSATALWTARRYTLRNVRRRLGQREDPWKGMMRHAQVDRGAADGAGPVAGGPAGGGVSSAAVRSAGRVAVPGFHG